MAIAWDTGSSGQRGVCRVEGGKSVNTTDSSQRPGGANWVVRIALVLVVGGIAVYGGYWFVESSRLSDRVNEIIASTHDDIYTTMLDSEPSISGWLEQAPVVWQPVIDSSADLLGTSAEDAHLLTIEMRDALMDCLMAIRAYEFRAFQVYSLLNSHPQSTLGQSRILSTGPIGNIPELNLNADVRIEDEAALARLFSAPRLFNDDFYTWDNDLALFQALRQGHGPELLERIEEVITETQTLTDIAREMNRSVHARISQSGLPQGQRTRMLSDWNDFAATIGGMIIPYEQNGRQFLVEYTRYVEYILAEIEPEELRLDRLHEIDRIRSRNLDNLRTNIDRAAR